MTKAAKSVKIQFKGIPGSGKSLLKDHIIKLLNTTPGDNISVVKVIDLEDEHKVLVHFNIK